MATPAPTRAKQLSVLTIAAPPPLSSSSAAAAAAARCLPLRNLLSCLAFHPSRRLRAYMGSSSPIGLSFLGPGRRGLDGLRKDAGEPSDWCNGRLGSI
ncbi:hypothetical protein ABZP36_012023 [Zizania latifolia]